MLDIQKTDHMAALVYQFIIKRTKSDEKQYNEASSYHDETNKYQIDPETNEAIKDWDTNRRPAQCRGGNVDSNSAWKTVATYW